MAERKPRATARQAKAPPPLPKPRIKLDPDRLEEIIAILMIIVGALTALGALNLSGGFLLGGWVALLQTLLGWGIYLAPILFLALGVWLFLDALDKTWNVGWERPIGIGLAYLILLAILHWVSAFSNPLQPPAGLQGGGIAGWLIASLLIGAFGAVGAFIALIAATFIALILLFNISLPELFRRGVYLARILSHLPQEIQQLGKKAAPAPQPPTRTPMPTMRASTMPARESTPASPLRAHLERSEGKEDTGEVARPVAARIIGGSAANSLAPSPAIQREWRLPEWQTFLEDSIEPNINQQEIRNRVRVIEETLSHFGVPAKVIEVNQGPSITQFGVEPGFIEQKGVDGKAHRVKVKVSRISALQHDLELALAASPLRIEAPVPGRSVVGIEVPNSKVTMVSLKSVMDSEPFKGMKSKLKIALGQDVSGQPVSASLETMPHLLIAGATGSGKSVCINAVIACLLCNTTPAELQMVMIDPKRVELVNFNGIPHLNQRNVVVEVQDAVGSLKQAVAEMDRRFTIFAKHGARNIEIYNHMIEGKTGEAKLPYLIVIVDELADLMMVAADDVERAITRLAQMARATGIHLILATQRPSVDVVTGLIKANFPSRISFAVTSQVDSRVVLDAQGAEKLLGRGDMLYMASDSSKLVRLQGCYVSDHELEKIVTYWKDLAPPLPEPERPRPEMPIGKVTQTTLWGGEVPMPKAKDAEDDLLPQALDIVKASQKASTSLLQRKLRIGYSRAARLMELLEEKGYVGPDEGPTKGRAVKAPAAPATARREFVDDDEFKNFSDEDWEELDKD
ncbi:MAG: DNA translocase FtsK [Chloroflexi bacterium]|nr:DNA translocase FtsK [Chloroflexota bacterium]